MLNDHEYTASVILAALVKSWEADNAASFLEALDLARDYLGLKRTEEQFEAATARVLAFVDEKRP